MSVSTVVGQITAAEVAYVPAVLAGVQAAETVDGATGASKAEAVIAGVLAGSQALSGAPNANVANIAALVNLTVSILNALGAFRHKAK